MRFLSFYGCIDATNAMSPASTVALNPAAPTASAAQRETASGACHTAIAASTVMQPG